MSVLKGNALAFALRLAEYRFRGTCQICLSNNELIKKMHVSKTTFYKYIAELKSANVVKENADGYFMSTDYFPVFPRITKEDKKKIEILMKMKDFLGKRVMLSYYKTGFNNLRMSISDFLDYCIAECPGLNVAKSETVIQKE